MTATQTIEILTYQGKCRNGHVVSIECTKYNVSAVLIHGWGIRCGCGALATGKHLNVTDKPDRRCDKRCTNATGVDCECSCGGKNHGHDKRF